MRSLHLSVFTCNVRAFYRFWSKTSSLLKTGGARTGHPNRNDQSLFLPHYAAQNLDFREVASCLNRGCYAFTCSFLETCCRRHATRHSQVSPLLSSPSSLPLSCTCTTSRKPSRCYANFGHRNALHHQPLYVQNPA